MSRDASPRTITVTREVHAGADRMWQVISTPGYLESCHPFCERNPVQRWPGGDAEDTIHYYGGRVVRRRFTQWLEGTGYDLVVVNADGVDQASVRWRIEPENPTACRLTVSLRILFLDHLASAARSVTYRLVVRPRMKRYLESVLAGVVHYTETGEPVIRNQFGSHSWFSPVADGAARTSSRSS